MTFRAKRILLLCALFLLPVLAAAAVDSGERDFERAKEGYTALTKSSRERLRRDKWLQVVERFSALADKHPRHRRAAESLFLAGKACEDLYAISQRPADLAQAATYFDRVADKYPASSLAPEALLLAAAIEERRNDPAQAYRRYRSVAERYPGHARAAQARQKVKELAKHAPPAAATGRNELTGIRLWSNPGYTRVVLDLSGPVDYTANFLAGDPVHKLAPRLYVDLRGTAPAAGLSEVKPVQDGLLRQIRAGRPDADTVRVVLDLVSIKDYKVFSLPDPMRIVLDITGDRPAELAALLPESSAQRAEPESAGVDKAPQEEPLQAASPVKAAGVLRRIVVDAGHGGKDPGAIGPSGVMEKDVVLAMAKELARQLRNEIGCDVILTRGGDVFLPLEERTAIANRVGADLFISVHANAAPNKAAYGIETYYLNFSKNDKAAAVAARENGTSLKQVGDLELILFDLMANSKINESSRLAAEIQRNLVHDLGRHYSQVRDLGVRQGPFYVLLGATMPSVLVEAAFISHPREEERLMDRKYHERTAAAIVRAVQQYANSLRTIAAQ